MPIPLLIAAMCLAEVLGMAGNATFPALIPVFRQAWGLSNTEAGWIGGVYYAGYIAAVPVLVSLTDRRDSLAIYLGSTALGGLSALGFAAFADGLWSAALFRALGGVGLAGTYMVGLRLLTDRLPERWQSRGVAWYTAHFSIGSSLSVLLAGEMAAWGGWQTAFWVAGGLSLGALAISGLVVGRQPVLAKPAPPAGNPLDLRPALRNRGALAYNLGYACHVWELFGYRAWIVAFLVFALARHGLDGLGGFSATQVATVLLVLGLPASVAGNELAMKLGRPRVISAVLLASGLLSCVLGFLVGLPMSLLLLLLAVYGLLIMADSSALTAGAVAAAEASRKGATMAVHSLLGFGAGFVAPLVFGVVLDLGGGEEVPGAWGLAFLSLGLVALCGPLVLRFLGAPKTV